MACMHDPMKQCVGPINQHSDTAFAVALHLKHTAAADGCCRLTLLFVGAAAGAIPAVDALSNCAGPLALWIYIYSTSST